MLARRIVLTALIAGLAFAGTAVASDKATADAAIAAAKAPQNEAASVAGQWRDPGDLIKKAEEAAGAGNFGSAVE